MFHRPAVPKGRAAPRLRDDGARRRAAHVRHDAPCGREKHGTRPPQRGYFLGVMDNQDHARALDRLTRALMGSDPAALSPAERASADMALVLLEAHAAAAKAMADVDAACARAGGQGADVERQLRDSAEGVRATLAAVDLRIARHPTAAFALATFPLGLSPLDELRLVASARAVWRALAPTKRRPKASPN